MPHAVPFELNEYEPSKLENFQMSIHELRVLYCKDLFQREGFEIERLRPQSIL